MAQSISLLQALKSLDVKDHRAARGRRFPLSSILALTVLAMLCGATSQAAICQFAEARGPDLLKLIGIRRRRGPTPATLCRVFAGLDVEAFEAVLASWVQGRIGPEAARRVAIDGKVLRGSRDGDLPAVHLLAAFAVQAEAVVGQLRVAADTNEHKAALELLGVLPLEGTVVTGDAMFTHRDFCETIVNGGGDYVLPIKGNQATLARDVADAFEDAPDGRAGSSDDGGKPGAGTGPDGDFEVATEVDKGHGRIERRSLTTTPLLNAYLAGDWPGIGQVFRLVRVRTVAGKTTVEVVYGLTSLGPEEASAEDLLELVRSHWGIENKLHWTRDETLGEDRCRVRAGGGAAAQAFAAMRNVVSYLINQVRGGMSRAAKIREFGWQPEKALGLVTNPL